MGSVKSVKTSNFKFDVLSVDGDFAEVRCSALIGEGKNGDLLFKFDGLSRNKPVSVDITQLWSFVTEFEARLAQLMSLSKRK